jgi:hypothetical protein
MIETSPDLEKVSAFTNQYSRKWQTRRETWDAKSWVWMLTLTDRQATEG